MSTLYKKHNYLNKNYKHLQNVIIREYDIKDAGFSIIIKNNLLDKKEILKIDNMTKLEKNIYIGKLMRKIPSLSVNILNQLESTRKDFILKNKIEDDEILYIKKDSICTINKKCETTNINGIIFKNKNNYSSYINLNGIEFYYKSDGDEITVKGISDDIVQFHNDFLLNDIKKILRFSEGCTSISIKNILKKILFKFRSDYIGMNLDINYYREFNSMNSFKFKNTNSIISFYLDEPSFLKKSKFLKNNLDITYNYLNYVIPLINILF